VFSIFDVSLLAIFSPGRLILAVFDLIESQPCVFELGPSLRICIYFCGTNVDARI